MRIERRTLGGIVLACAAAGIHGALAGDCPVGDAEFRKKALVTALDEPFEIDVDARDRVFIAERVSGRVKIYQPGTGETVVAGKVENHDTGHNSVGLIGLALDPRFEVNGHLYVNYALKATGDAEGRMRIARFTVTGDRLDMASEVAILEFPLNYRCCHQAGSLEFGRDGDLFIATGNTYTGKDFEQSLEVSPNPHDWAGKILRIRPTPDGGYVVPEGNLYAKASDGIPEIYVSGARNPFRIGVDPKSNWLLWGEVGPDGPRMEEFNLARSAGFFGYPYFFGNNESTTVTGGQSAAAPTYAGVALAPAQPAVLSYTRGEGKYLKGPGATVAISGIQGSCPFGGPRIHWVESSPSATRLPRAWDGKWVLLEFTSRWVRLAGFDQRGYLTGLEHVFGEFDYAGLMDAAVSPRGDLYLLEYGDQWRENNANSGVYKVEYTGGCNPVVAETAWLQAYRSQVTALAPRTRRDAGSRAVPRMGGFVDVPAGASGFDCANPRGQVLWSWNRMEPPAAATAVRVAVPGELGIVLVRLR